MSFAPGKRTDSFTGQWKRDLEADLLHLRRHYRIERILSLLDPSEYRGLGIAGYPLRVVDHGFELLEHPVPDGGVPADAETFLTMLDEQLEALRSGVRLLVHCRSGLGRTGLVAATLLVRGGWVPVDEVVDYLRSRRRNAVEHASQKAWVRDHALAGLDR
jgi:protein-tyrosine phosphatase